MTPINIQVIRWKVKVKGEPYSWYVGEGGISVSQTSIFVLDSVTLLPCQSCSHLDTKNIDKHLVSPTIAAQIKCNSSWNNHGTKFCTKQVKTRHRALNVQIIYPAERSISVSESRGTFALLLSQKGHVSYPVILVFHSTLSANFERVYFDVLSNNLYELFVG